MYIRKCDIISPQITLYYKGDRKHSSIFSGCISIILTIFVFIVCLIISFDFLLKINPTSFYFITKIKDIGTINLNQNYFFHFITFINENNRNDAFNENEFSLIGINNISIGNLLNKDLSEYNFSHWKYERCNTINTNDKEIIKEKYYNISLCISKFYDSKTNTFINYYEKNFPYPILENNIETEHYINYGIILKECENNTLYNNSCYFSSNILEKQMRYIFNYYSNNIDVDNYKNPIEKQLSNKVYNYSPLYLNLHEINLQQTIIRTSDGIFFDLGKKLSTYNINNFFDDNIPNENNKIIEMINIKMTNKAEIYHREYKKFQDIIGSVDGTIELMIFIIKFLNNFFYHDFRLVNDFNEVIGKKAKKLRKFNNKNDLSNSSELKNNKSTNNNFITDNRYSSKFLDLPKIFPLIKGNSMRIKQLNNFINNEDSPKIQHSVTESRIVTDFQELNYINYINNYFKCFRKKKNHYVERILSLRKLILSEERLLKNYWKIKILKEGLTDVKVKSDNISFTSFLITNKKKNI